MIVLGLGRARELDGDIVQPTAKCRRLPVPAAASKRDVILPALDKAKGRDKPSCSNVVGNKGPGRDAHAEAAYSRFEHEVEVLELSHRSGSRFDTCALAPVGPC